ncbi:hypothetical protein M434DRAFT_37002 [Hypoxylon sp. CO27-5]|nr:hypothetical protein M434DRAFT_37002 [Hypoxylon sp. CO27-5]
MSQKHLESSGLNDKAITIEEEILKNASHNKKISTISDAAQEKALEDRPDEKQDAKLRAQLKKAYKKNHDEKHGHSMDSNKNS